MGGRKTRAWLLRGLTQSVPGILAATNERLAFRTQDALVFDAALSEVTEVYCPWYYFGGGLKFRIGNQRYRFSFVRPNDSSDASDRLEARSEAGVLAGLDLTTGKLADIRNGRHNGKAWKSFLLNRNTGS